MSRIFISYRREDSEGDTGRIADRLIARFGADDVFYDRESLGGGDRWRERINAELAGCKTMLVVMGPQWETLSGPDGRPRLMDPDDMVAYEVGSAIGRGVQLIPVLVRRQELPLTNGLPTALLALRDSQAQRLHADAFTPLMQVLIDKIEGRRWLRPKQVTVLAAGLMALGLATWWGTRGGPADKAPAQALLDPRAVAAPAVVNEQIAGSLRLRFTPPADASSEPEPGEGPARWLMAMLDPVVTKSELTHPSLAPGRVQEFVLEKTLLPRSGERYEADFARQVETGRRTGPGRTTLCLRRTSKAPVADLLAVVTCEEGQRCKADQDNPGHFVVTCSDAAPSPAAAPAPSPAPAPAPARKVGQLDWHWPWLSSALAQTPAVAATQTPGPPPPPAQAVNNPPNPLPSKPSCPASAVAADDGAGEIWALPSLKTLQRRKAAGQGRAYTEVTLKSPPLTALPALADLQTANRVSVALKLNGRSARIDGLPPEASAEPFDAKQGLFLQFGLENLDFSGAHGGREKLALTLRFWDKQKLVHETQATLNYVALRSKEDTPLPGDTVLGARWSAQYVPGGGADQWQVFLLSAHSLKGVEDGKCRFDAAAHSLALGGEKRPLVAVIRPPLNAGGAWGLNVGTQLRNGQIQFSFTGEESAMVCRALMVLSRQPRTAVRPDSYRRSLDGRQDVELCAKWARP